MKLAVVLILAACRGSPAAVDPDGGGGGLHDALGSGSGSSDLLYPLASGNSWTFTVAAVGDDVNCAPGSYTQSIVSANDVGGRTAFQMTNFCTEVSGTYDYAAGSGDEVDFYYSDSWLTLVDPTLVEGHSWTYFNTSYTWHRETSVTVPAGTYDDCWTANQDVSYTAYLTYCRGVGLVRSYSSDLTSSGWDAQLASSVVH
jgi:hypothetical protein